VRISQIFTSTATYNITRGSGKTLASHSRYFSVFTKFLMATEPQVFVLTQLTNLTVNAPLVWASLMWMTRTRTVTATCVSMNAVLLYWQLRYVCLPVQPGEMNHDEEITQLLSSQQRLEFHVNRTQTWLAHLGWWKAHILHADVSHLLLFVV